ncbi:DUF4214 domain-containing protein [Allofranklinella schreckenbergeri]|uniref:DUF4214 domain-containing protein n=1 Tax=Allofranklinella schreckenbergeri TaxID=1076744 RepID=A0A3M6Q3T5_9BURK|nr:DUF4214 domain-containing protein [Allofranklinella schreckenbergeri]RMW97795.1 DUF4214 domain-containing protein [Allofranklinella schreckenbergeri]
MAVSDHFDNVQKIYLAFYQRPADPGGLTYWADQVEQAGGDISKVIDAFANSAEATALYGKIDETTIGNVIDAVYKALFNVTPDQAGKDYYVEGFKAGTFGPGTIALNILNGAQGNDLTAIKNKLDAAEKFTKVLDPELDGAGALATYNAEDAVAVRKWLAGVDAVNRVSEDQVKSFIKTTVASPTDPINGGVQGTQLTLAADRLFSDADGAVFKAPVEQNMLGSLNNTLASGDVILATGKGAKLQADLVETVIGAHTNAPAINPTVTGVEVVEIRALEQATSGGGGTGTLTASQVDAENFYGVKEWWSVNSRATVQIEDVRARPEETLLGFRSADATPTSGTQVDFNVFFNPDMLHANTRAKDSSISLMIDSISKPGDLSQVPADGVIFELAGKQYTVRADAIGEAKNHAEFMAALTAELAKEPALAGLQATLSGNEVTLVDPAGGTFKQGGWTFKNNIVPSSGDIKWAQSVGKATDVTEPVSTTLVLDKVGHSTSQGGSVNIGSAGAGGIEVFDLKVGGSSWVRKIESKAEVEHSLKGDQHLAEVKISHLEDGVKGGLKVGEVSTNTDGRVQANGFTNVREISAEGFTGALNLGIALTADAVKRYLGPDVKEPVEFAYVGGEGADLFNIAIDGAVTADPDFRGKIDLGAGDDRLVLKADKLDQIKIDGGEGRNTIVVEGAGLGAGSLKPNEFKNLQVYEIGGTNHTNVGTHTFTSLESVEEVIVATGKPHDVFVPNNAPPPPMVFDHREVGGAKLVDFNGDKLLVTGREQTVTDGNADQGFTELTLNGANKAAVTVTLDNTARKDGKLTVDSMKFGDNGADLSQVHTLTMESKGVRETSNVVRSIEAGDVSTFNIKGSQQFTTQINDAAGYNDPVAKQMDFTVNASELKVEADKPGLNLTVDADIVTAIDVNAEKVVRLTGSEGKDALVFTNGLAGGAVTGLQLTSDTSVAGFETIQFGRATVTRDPATNAITKVQSEALGDAGAGSSFNAVNVSGEKKFIIADIANGAIPTPFGGALAGAGAGLELVNLDNAAVVDILAGFEHGGVSAGAAGDVTLRGAGVREQIDINLVDGNNAASTWLTGARKLEVGGFKTINLNVGASEKGAADANAYNFALNLMDQNGHVHPEAGFVLSGGAGWTAQGVAARTLNVTGGDASVKNAVGSDSLTLNNLDAALQVVDLSGYHGQVTGGVKAVYVGDAATQPQLTDLKVVVGGYNTNWTVTTSTAVGEGYNTTFEFTKPVGLNATKAVWQITGFVAGEDVAIDGSTKGDENSITKLNLKQLGITNETQLKVTHDGANTVIQSQDEFATGAVTWEIKLMGGNFTGGDLKLNYEFA